MIRVVLVDDQPKMRAAFRTILEAAEIEVVGEAGDGDSACTVVRTTRPDVALMDVRMPGRDGISATAVIVAEHPATKVLMLTTFDDDDVLYGALAAGAAGFLLKNSTPESLVGAIHQVAGGDAVLDAAVADRVFARFAKRIPSRDHGQLDRLTERERDVLRLMCKGQTNGEIATTLGMGEATAKTHVSRVLMKLGVRDRVQAVIYSYEVGFATA